MIAEWKCTDCGSEFALDTTVDNLESMHLIKYCPYCGKWYERKDRRF